MEDSISQIEAHPLAEAAPSPKRRKLRKGTQSCWECRRRKSRCTFSAASDDICEGCRRRGTACLSQEFPDQPPAPGTNRHIVDRLDQVEALVGQLVKAANNVSDDPDVHPGRNPDEERLQRGRSTEDDALSRSRQTKPSRPLAAAVSPGTDYSAPEKYREICRGLLTAWPSQQDLNIILEYPIEPSSIIRGVVCTQLAHSTSLAPPSPRALLQLPPPESHPVLIAQKLLILGTFLQGMPASRIARLRSLGCSYQEIMSRVVMTAHNLVTSNDDLVASIEGIECIMLEGLYENYAGNLRRSWLTARRAVMIAQMLGLDRGVKPASLTGAAFKPDYLWFRLVQFDRYLSLMLGLPQSLLEDCFATPEALEPCLAFERMHRLTCVAAGRILKRSPSELYDSDMTREIDKVLRDASTVMPAQWWVAPTLSACDSPKDRIRETLRFNDHFTHYHLLVQLHLPYLLHDGGGREFEYNRMTAVTASREILSRFLTFRTFHSTGHYCRGVDFLAFVSSTTLFLAHIKDDLRGVSDKDGFHFLTHQRLSDRGMLERTLANMQESRINSDAITTRVITLLESILAIEEDIAAGSRYTAGFSPGSRDEEKLGCRVRLSDDGAVLNIYLPHFWVIKVERDQSQANFVRTIPPQRQISLSPRYTPTSGIRPTQDGEQPRGTLGVDQDDISSTSPIWQNLSLPQLIPLAKDDGHSDPENPQRFDVKDTIRLGPDQDTSLENWALQDVDISFFDSLIQGPTVLDAPDVS